ncbi:hypothetical protein DV711_18120 [Motiliproteus coralliicola]|uniref:Uncharacterized protein n=2 Tax=Motiliproteus coralliicola TaxID=2283196 RepID=A0A369W9P4_9GAMM|nr:hypothetical protein DV711_18120 [Motiliproteus coralliicola]
MTTVQFLIQAIYFILLFIGLFLGVFFSGKVESLFLNLVSTLLVTIGVLVLLGFIKQVVNKEIIPLWLQVLICSWLALLFGGVLGSMFKNI